MMTAPSPGGACSGFCLKEREHQRSLEAVWGIHKLHCLGKGCV